MAGRSRSVRGQDQKCPRADKHRRGHGPGGKNSMSKSNANARRPHGTGSLRVRRDRAGQETWYASWRVPGGRRIKRKVGPKRLSGTGQGLTKAQAEAELRRMMGES